MYIRMGNDEFILYIRKKVHGKTLKNDIRNDKLGKMIWNFVEDKCGGINIEQDVECVWNLSGWDDAGYGLPKTAAQYDFKIEYLPRIYKELDKIILSII